MQHFSAASEENARYCLDRAVSVLIKKQNHLDLSRQLADGPESTFQVKLKSDQPLYAKASTKSEVRHTLQQGQHYRADAIVSGLTEEKDFIKIAHMQDVDPRFLLGYVLDESCEIVTSEDKSN